VTLTDMRISCLVLGFLLRQQIFYVVDINLPEPEVNVLKIDEKSFKKMKERSNVQVVIKDVVERAENKS
jgi:hypothetical protein